MFIPSNKNKIGIGMRFKVYSNGTVYLNKENLEVGYIDDEKIVEEIFNKELIEFDVDNIVKENISVPATLVKKVQPILDEIREYKPIYKKNNNNGDMILKMLKVEIVKEMLGEEHGENFVKKYLDYIRKKQGGFLDEKIEKMYPEYLLGATIEDLAVKYEYKTPARVQLLLGRYALALQKNKGTFSLGVSDPRNEKIAMLSQDDILKYGPQLLRDGDWEFIKRSKIDGESMRSIADSCGSDKSVLYTKRRRLMLMIVDMKDAEEVENNPSEIEETVDKNY